MLFLSLYTREYFARAGWSDFYRIGMQITNDYGVYTSDITSTLDLNPYHKKVGNEYFDWVVRVRKDDKGDIVRVAFPVSVLEPAIK